MISEFCLPLHAQKAVVGKLLGLQVIVPQLSSLDPTTAERLDRNLCWLTDAALDDPDHDDTLEAFLTNLVSTIRVEMEGLPEIPRPGVAHIIQEFADLVAAFCRSPYDPLERLVKAVAQTSSDFYRTYGAEVPQELWQQALPMFSFLKGKVGLSFAPDIHLKMYTEFNEKETFSAEVFLKIVPRWLDAKTAAALPRVILHEYIAHVPQGPHTENREHPDSSDSFAEGWMDYLAHQVHRAVLERRGPFHALAEQLLPTWTTFYEDAANHFFEMRRERRDDDPSAAARCQGAMAGRLLHDLLRKLPETKDDADAYLFRLSFGLNSSALAFAARERLVNVILRRLSLASEADTVAGPLRKWAGGGMALEQLWESLLAIRSSDDV